MKRILFFYIIPVLCALIAGYTLYVSLINSDFVNNKIKLEIVFDANQQGILQLFVEDKNQFKASIYRNAETINPVKDYHVEMEVPIPDETGRMRIDPGFTRGEWKFKQMTLKGYRSNIVLNADSIFNKFKPANDIKLYRLDKDGVYLESNGNDPYIVSSFSLKKYLKKLYVKPFIYPLPFILSCCIGFFIYYLIRKKLQIQIDSSVTANHFLLFAFLLLITLPVIWMNLFPAKSATGENRKLKEKPAFSFSTIIDYPKQFNKYFDDNFGFKKPLAILNSYYKLKLFRVSSKPDLVAIGKNSWLFSTDKNTVGDYQNRVLFTDDELKKIKYNLEEAYNWYDSKGIHFFVMVFPLKSNIYPENLPSSIKREKNETKLLQVRDYMAKNSFVKIIYITDEMLKTKPKADVYYQHDIHMNFNGGYLGYFKLMNEMKKYNPALKPDSLYYFHSVFMHKHDADLSRFLSLEDILLNDQWKEKKKTKLNFMEVDPPAYDIGATIQPTVRTIIPNSKLPKVIVYRDSFFNLMFPYFSDKFSDCIYIWSNEMSVNVIEREHPDFVVYETLESGINKLLEDNPSGFRKN